MDSDSSDDSSVDPSFDDSPNDDSPNETTCFPQFNELPPEIKEHIIRQRPKLILAFSLVNKELHQLCESLYLKKVGRRSIRSHEIAKYRETNPLIFGSHNHVYNSMTAGEVNASVCIRRPGYVSFHENYNYWHINVKMEFDSRSLSFSTHYDNVSNVINDMFLYDYMTQYHILSKRLSCVRLNPTYAKDYILRYFDRWYQSCTDDAEDKMSYYLIMWINANVFHITPPPKEIFNLKFISIDEMLKVADEETERLHTAIRKAIMKLD